MKQPLSIIIIGTGVAGLMAAHQLADVARVTLITKNLIMESNSALAQGGVAAAVDKDDHPQAHLADTLAAGSFFNHRSRARDMVNQAPNLIDELVELGVPFEKTKEGYMLANEGAHSKRRVLHALKDQTGKAIVEVLQQVITGRVVQLDEQLVTEIVVKQNKVQGIIANGCFKHADAVMLASGGAGQLYRCTTNTSGATGDGLYLAYQAGAVLKDLEFIQFHPTVLKTKGSGLISEAVRGEGAHLVNKAGKRLMSSYPRQDLEARDVVSAVMNQAIKRGEDVFLDATHMAYFAERFPFIHKSCRQAGIDPAVDYIPVEPGAHFMCGGVETSNVGETSVSGLYAIGEVACTGVHGANRLASNSLLEALHFAKVAASHLSSKDSGSVYKQADVKEESGHQQNHMLPFREELQDKMSQFVGIERSEEGLLAMEKWLQSFRDKQTTKQEQFEDRCLYELALFITKAARARKETRGTHRRMDYPNMSTEWKDQSVLFQKKHTRGEGTFE
ncbi:L-aspartate oxidase [Shouchella patagoniensis]|uniref:L-aspartate oxidase n=1 Tax=Shouchella patagoniensis TaxID=228576 RepID=UPI00099517AD|nr:L-aspartate oxidase [Shouchella patagoniensis]